MTDQEKSGVFPLGNPNDAFAQYFVGQSYLSVLTAEGVTICNVTFEPGCRNNWHIHRAEEGGRSCFAQTAGAGIRNGERKHRNCTPAMPLSFPQV